MEYIFSFFVSMCVCGRLRCRTITSAILKRFWPIFCIKMILEILQFFHFQNGDRPPYWIFKISIFFVIDCSGGLWPCQISLKIGHGCRDNIYRFKKWRPTAILYFLIFEFLGLQLKSGRWDSVRHRAKFVKLGQTVLKILHVSFLKMVSVRHLGFSKFQNFNKDWAGS